jgi:hypothetical protein
MPRNTVLLLLAIILLIVLLDYREVITIPFYSMNAQHYGFPVLNIFIPIICFILIRDISLLISRVHLLKELFIAIGQAALPIMFLQMILPILFIQGINTIMGLRIDGIVLRIALGIVLPYILYCFFSQFGLTKKMFLGKWQ